ncbi:MAG: 2-amino-4-hydroxy-6-hydroxymethyldihydropteridine diphosphokinase [candidate division Zixibacteria bacterium]|nr:2-amino-4-hydroxy-6-hydroxymethyldihydropteridine diphosphokinase [candidate division Zixibacteria bacterium]
MATVHVSLGSNLGDRFQHLRTAIEKIEESDKILIKEVSSVYESEPVGYENQRWFLNLVFEVQTSFDPLLLLEYLLAIEDQMGRKREEKWGARNIDLDLLLYDNLIVNSDRLTIPHPQMHQRRFVLIPLAQIAPQLLHPLLKKTVRQLLESCEDKSMVKLYSEKI